MPKLIELGTVILVAVITIQLEAKAIESNPSDGLYNSSDAVVILNATNFKAALKDGRTAWVVEFYRSWCGHCQRFASTWKIFARDIAGWNNIVRVAAVDCANEINEALCTEYEADFIPLVRYFSVGGEGLGVDIENLTETDKPQEQLQILRQELIANLQEDQLKGQDRNWPNLRAHRSIDRTNLTSGIYHFLLFEDSNSSLGAEIILDFSAVDGVKISRVVDIDETFRKMYGVTAVPSFVAVDRSGGKTHLELPVSSRGGVGQVLKHFLRSKNLLQDLAGEDHDESTTSRRPETQPFAESTARSEVADVLYQADLESALRYSLDHEIPQRKYIDGGRLQALRNYLQILSRYFPLRRGNPRFFSRLDEALSGRSNITGRDFADLVALYQTEMAPVFTEKKEWVSCRSSRAYSCGLWTMFHTLSVNHAALWEDSESAGAVLEAILGYIGNFFGCSECAEHFVEMAERRELSKVKTGDESVLWLWKAHNEVNERLAKEDAGNPEFPKIQYPSEANCPKCRGPEGRWVESEVLGYLKKKYAASAIYYKMGT